MGLRPTASASVPTQPRTCIGMSLDRQTRASKQVSDTHTHSETRQNSFCAFNAVLATLVAAAVAVVVNSFVDVPKVRERRKY